MLKHLKLTVCSNLSGAVKKGYKVACEAIPDCACGTEQVSKQSTFYPDYSSFFVVFSA